MKKYNWIIVLSVMIYLCLAFFSGQAIFDMEDKDDYAYRIEGNRIVSQLETGKSIEQVNMKDYEYIQKIEFLNNKINNQLIINDFFSEDNHYRIYIQPLYQENQFQGYIKMSYQLPSLNSYQIIFVLEISLLILEVFILLVLFNMKRKLIQPFWRLSDLPLQLAKGHLKGDVKEEKSKYFGKFMWGIGQLKDTLDVSQKRQLELLKEKKEMLLSLSHDMKTPLNLISLYSKALEEDIYSDKQSQKHALHQISKKVIEIEKYIDEIMKSSREDILDIQVHNEEFYLQDLINRVLSVYSEQCALRQIQLTVRHYENKLVNGDLERCQEVFENLFENAFKYGDGRHIDISFDEEDYCQLIRVYNTGETVSDTEFNHLFDSFFRGSHAHGQKGSGLGLYICHELMQKMDGAIFAEKCDDGMAFVVVLR